MQHHGEHHQQSRRDGQRRAPMRAPERRLRAIDLDGFTRLAQHDAVDFLGGLERITGCAPEQRLAPRQEVVEFLVGPAHVRPSAAAIAALSLPTA
jgi:hypothetical protein